MTAPTEHDVAARMDQLARLREAIGQAVVGQSVVVEQLLIGLLAGGHCLIEGVPGLGKTLLVRTLGQALALDFRRVQFTPDLMPSDILGTEILEEDHGTGRRHFKFQPGPVFTNLLLADELNRTPPKTQAALLEAMQEKTVSYAGVTHELPAPFFVLATQNPLEQAGTYPLPEAQLDRFLLHVRVDYPTADEERDIIEQTTGTRTAAVPQVMTGDEVLALQARVREVHLGADLLEWITRLVRASRPGDGAPPEVMQWVRGAIAGARGEGARAAAWPLRGDEGRCRGARGAGAASSPAAVVHRGSGVEVRRRRGRRAAARGPAAGRLSGGAA